MVYDEEVPAGDIPAPHLLVVEDEVLIRVAVADYFRECGFEVYLASNTNEAKAILEAGLIVHVVFTDVEMPGEMNGFALARWVKEHHSDIEVIVTSDVARMASDAADLCESAAFVAKPYDHALLADRVKELLARRDRTTREL